MRKQQTYQGAIWFVCPAQVTQSGCHDTWAAKRAVGLSTPHLFAFWATLKMPAGFLPARAELRAERRISMQAIRNVSDSANSKLALAMRAEDTSDKERSSNGHTQKLSVGEQYHLLWKRACEIEQQRFDAIGSLKAAERRFLEDSGQTMIGIGLLHMHEYDL